jgi:nicotinamidase/pyrazinamidase
MAEDKRRALIIVDVQNDFCPGGSLAVERGDEVVEPLNQLARQFLARGDLVVKSRDWHPSGTKHFAAYGGTWPIHCVQGTHGAEFHPRLIEDPRIPVVSKDKMDIDE